jgi:DNA-directed RNA polymerase specialized sigma24 family protein
LTQSPAQPTDELVRYAAERAGAGDGGAIAFLRARLMEDVEERVRESVGDSPTAHRMAERIFAELPETLRSYDAGVQPFAEWLIATAGEANGRFARAHSNGVSAETHANGRARSESPAALWRLDPDQRAVVVMHRVGGLSIADVGRRLGKPETTVRRLDARAQIALRG